MVRFIAVCSATETILNIETLYLACLSIILSRKRITKALISLHGRIPVGWYTSLFFAYKKLRLDGAQMNVNVNMLRCMAHSTLSKISNWSPYIFCVSFESKIELYKSMVL